MSDFMRQQQRKGAILPLVAVMLVALLLIVAVTINSNWFLYHQINTQNAADISARSSLARITGDFDFEGRTTRARELGDRLYQLNMDRTALGIANEKIQFGSITDPNAAEPTFVENASDNDPITAVRVFAGEGDALPVWFSSMLGGPDNVEINADATVSTRPIDVMLCLDCSRSMNRTSEVVRNFPPGGTSINEKPLPGSRFFELRDTVELFIDAMQEINPNARVGLVTFGGGFEGVRTGGFLIVSDLDADYARLELGLTTVIDPEIEEINDTLQSYEIDHPALGLGTSLFDGITTSVAEFNNGEATRHIIMLSDGSQAAVPSRPAAMVAAQSASTEGVVIHTISFGGNFAVMDDIAQATGGSNFTASSEEELREAFGQLLGRFRVELVD